MLGWVFFPSGASSSWWGTRPPRRLLPGQGLLGQAFSLYGSAASPAALQNPIQSHLEDNKEGLFLPQIFHFMMEIQEETTGNA